MSTGQSYTLPEEPLLTSRAVLFLTACSYLCVALSFSYLDRRYGFFSGEGVFWIIWTLLGFGAALLYQGRGARAAEVHWKIMGGVALLFVLFIFLKYNLLRWASVSLLLVLSARAVVLRTRRDFYLTLTVIFVVSLMVATYWTVNWTVWFYLAPAWLFAALALAWEHAAGVAVSRWAKGGLTVGFISLSFMLAMLLFLFAPRPPTLGFGFLPPGTETPNLNTQSGGGQGTQHGEGGRQGHEGRGGSGGGSQQAGAGGQGWQQMFERMRRDLLGDQHMPEWQRGTLLRLLGWGELLGAALRGELVWGGGRKPGIGVPGEFTPVERFQQAIAEQIGKLKQMLQDMLEQLSRLSWLDWLLLLLGLWLIYRGWRRRYQLVTGLLLTLASGLLRWQPMLAMRLSLWALLCCLRQQGHRRAPGQSLREQLASARALPDLPHRWLTYALELYGEVRFGRAKPTAQRAAHMHKAVYGASQILSGVMPELQRA